VGSQRTIGFAANFQLLYALAADLFMGAKFVSHHSIVGELSSGLHFGQGALDIKDTKAFINKCSTVGIRKTIMDIFS
jgi:hypothetical protein